VVSVGGDDEAGSEGFGLANQGRGDIEALRTRVDLEKDISAGGFAGDLLEIEREGIAVEKDATGGMADGADVGTLESAE